MQRPILVLGGGRHQISLIKSIQAAGYPVILSDYLPSSPGHNIAEISTLTDTLDKRANVDLAVKHNIQGIITTGTDQPLVVMADVASSLGIPCYLTPECARTCTDKKRMFEILSKAGLEIPRYLVVDNISQLPGLINELKFPLIVKPCDSQGQRGITTVSGESALAESVELAWHESSSRDIIVQEFVSGPEMTISVWVTQGYPQIMLVTDRVTYNKSPATGVCLQHIYPSSSIQGLEQLATEFSKQIVDAYGLREGPVYIQCVRQQDRLYLIEATCRIGGGHEELLIQAVTGVNVHEHLLSLTLTGKSPDFPDLGDYPVSGKFAMVNFIVAHPGCFKTLSAPASSEESPYGGFYYEPGYQQCDIINSMGRVGYFVFRSSSRERMMDGAANHYKKFIATNAEGKNLVFWPEPKYLNK